MRTNINDQAKHTKTKHTQMKKEIIQCTDPDIRIQHMKQAMNQISHMTLTMN